MEFQVDPTTRVPIYRQLMDQIRWPCARGRLKPGSRLPSVRVLSRELVVNPEHDRPGIHRAGTRGRAQHAARHGRLRGRAAAGDLSAAARRQRLAEIIDSFLTDAVHLGFSADEVLSAVAKRTRGFQFVDGVQE